jgi:hypothetical protein
MTSGREAREAPIGRRAPDDVGGPVDREPGAGGGEGERQAERGRAGYVGVAKSSKG